MNNTARIHVRFDEVVRRWETRVTFDVPDVLVDVGSVTRDGLVWPYFRPRSRSRNKVILKSVKQLLDQDHRGAIEIVQEP